MQKVDKKSQSDIDFLQLSENNIFMNELNSVEIFSNIKYYTIAGDVDKKGDGLVLKESVRIEGAENIVVPCSHISLSLLFCKEASDFTIEVINNG